LRNGMGTVDWFYLAENRVRWRGTRWRSWLRHCATSQKDRRFDSRWSHWNFSVALWSTQPLTEMSTRNPSWGQRRPVRRADNLTTFVCRLSGNSSSLNLLEPQGAVQACRGKALRLLYPLIRFSQRYWWKFESSGVWRLGGWLPTFRIIVLP
jgi:hypothetical protein